MTRLHDVVVVGSGPAGSTCARQLARRGHDVVLVDSRNFPRDKPCGGAFSPGLMDEFPYLKKRESEFVESISRVGRLHSPNSKIVLSGHVELAMVLRYRFDAILHEEAIHAGAISLLGSRARGLEFNADHVEVRTGRGECIRARFVVGADGVNSFVARATGLNRKWPRQSITACQVVEVPMDASLIADIYGVDRDYSFYACVGGQPGYGWVFPKHHTVNVGLGVVGRHSMGLPAKFRSFMSLLERQGMIPDGSHTSRLHGALVPTAGPIPRSYCDRCLLVGDSAGMVNPLTGGGIAYSMRAARFAAAVLNDCIENDTSDESSLSQYERLWKADFGKEMKRLLIAQKLFTSSFADVMFHVGSRDPELQSIVAEAMTESGGSGIDAKRLGIRVLYVCLREALGII